MKENISELLIQLLNYRIKQEEISARLYKAMSLWLNFNGYLGASKLWNSYSEEEFKHAQWSYDYLLDLDVLPELPELPKPETSFIDLVDIINRSYKHEQEVTKQCQELAKKAMQELDFMTLELAQKYLKEQQEELSKTVTWLDRLEAFGTSKEALRLLDNEMNEQ